MPRYFFDTDDGTEQLRDEVGLELAGDQAARDEATRGLAEMAKDYLPGGPPQRSLAVWVRCETGDAVLQVSCNFAVQPLR